MGREQELRLNAVRALEARIERGLGAIRPHGEVGQCEKCGLVLVASLREGGVTLAQAADPPQLYRYCLGKDLMAPESEQQCPLMGEHLHRQCPRCRWMWCERTRDYAEVTA